MRRDDSFARHIHPDRRVVPSTPRGIRLDGEESRMLEELRGAAEDELCREVTSSAVVPALIRHAHEVLLRHRTAYKED